MGNTKGSSTVAAEKKFFHPSVSLLSYFQRVFLLVDPAA